MLKNKDMRLIGEVKMQIKILGISGSPVRKGNVETILNRMLDFARERGASTETVYSNVRMKARLDGPLRYPTFKEGLPTLIDWYRDIKALPGR